jgi:hypothetical protein
MKREIIRETVYHKSILGNVDVKIKDLHLELTLPDDIIWLHYQEPYDDGDSSNDNSFTIIDIVRERLENDEEYQKRMENEQKLLELRKKARYETYLKLKKEFENI